MKFFLLIVSAFVVLTVHGRDLPDDYGGRGPGATENPDSAVLDFKTSEDAYPFISNPAPGYMAQRKAGSKCEAQDMCIIMGGTCVNNASLCQGRLLPGCKGKNCKCCVYGNLEIMIHNLEQEMQTIKDNLNSELQHLKDNLTDSNSNLNEEFDHLKDDLTDSNSNLSEEFETLKDNLEEKFKNLENNLTDANANLNSEFENLKDNQEEEFETLKSELTNGNSELSNEIEDMSNNINKSFSNMQSKIISMMPVCPWYFFSTNGSTQCYKFFDDVTRNWDEAKKKCQDEGLELAEPTNPLSVRIYLTEKYASGSRTYAYAYLGARGTGSHFRWQGSGEQISNTDPLWFPGRPGKYVSTNYCLMLLAESTYNLPKYPKTPYSTDGCTTKRFTLCEYVRN